jgi:hypothetical protein
MVIIASRPATGTLVWRLPLRRSRFGGWLREIATASSRCPRGRAPGSKLTDIWRPTTVALTALVYASRLAVHRRGQPIH